MVMTGGMFNQQLDALRLIALAHQHGKPAVVGGPDATSSPHIYEAADFRVLGEVEDVIARFIAVWNAGERGGCSPPKSSRSTSARRRRPGSIS